MIELLAFYAVIAAAAVAGYALVAWLRDRL